MGDTSLTQWFEGFLDDVTQVTEEVAEDVGFEAERYVVDLIETRGTGKTWKRTYYKDGVSRSGSTPGRVWSGEMVGSIKNEVTAAEPAVRVEWGWLDNYEDYFGQQEVGFFHEYAGSIPGMFAMADSIDYMVNYVDQELGVKLRAV